MRRPIPADLPSFLLGTFALAAASLAIAACGDSGDGGNGDGDGDGDGITTGSSGNDDVFFCRETPIECEGDIGGRCSESIECGDGECCFDKNCGGGMCTFLCEDDRGCPEGMACEHQYCFFQCTDDRDCGPDQKCEHGKTICEYAH